MKQAVPLTRIVALLYVMWILAGSVWAEKEPTRRGKTIEAWLMQLQSLDANTRRAACQALGEFEREGEAAALPLAKALKDEQTAVRLAAADALRRIGPRAAAAAPTLSATIGDPDRGVSAAAMRALGEIGPPAKDDAVPALLRLVNGRDTILATLALQALGQVGDSRKEVVASLRKAIQHADRSVRVEALRTWADALDTEQSDAAALVAPLGDGDAQVRQAALDAWQHLHLGNPLGHKALIALLKDADPLVRRQAVAALQLPPLSEKADANVVEALEKALSDSDAGVRLDAVLSLARRDVAASTATDGRSANYKVAKGSSSVVLKAMTEADAVVRAEAARVFSHLRLDLTDESRAALARLLKDANSIVRLEAALAALDDDGSRATGSTGGTKAPAPRPELATPARAVLMGLLKHREADVRTQALLALERAGAVVGEVQDVVLRLMHTDPTPQVRQAAVLALRWVELEKADYESALEKRLGDGAVLVRVTAAARLRALDFDGAQAAKVLAEGLNHADVQVRLTTLRALPPELWDSEDVLNDPSPVVRRLPRALRMAP